MPTEEQWKAFDQLLEHHAARIMLWEDEPMPQVAEILSKKGVQALVFNPCENQPVSGDFIETMNKNIQTLQN
jgi:ABC-type Zn uptake system ZnuABC Zn-binding protein ZnuA